VDEKNTGRYWHEHINEVGPHWIFERYEERCELYPMRDCPGVCHNDGTCARMGQPVSVTRTRELADTPPDGMPAVTAPIPVSGGGDPYEAALWNTRQEILGIFDVPMVIDDATVEKLKDGFEKARHGPVKLLTPLPWRIRLRLWWNGKVDKTAIWLSSHGKPGAALWLWHHAPWQHKGWW
jgi:hypothetical protein